MMRSCRTVSTISAWTAISASPARVSASKPFHRPEDADADQFCRVAQPGAARLGVGKPEVPCLGRLWIGATKVATRNLVSAPFSPEHMCGTPNQTDDAK
jgi:hypothetical protein